MPRPRTGQGVEVPPPGLRGIETDVHAVVLATLGRSAGSSHAGSTSDDQGPLYRAVPRTAKHLCASLCVASQLQ